MRILKYTIPIIDVWEIEIPGGGDILSIQNQGGKIRFWAMVNEAMPGVKRKFTVCPTGSPIVGDVVYLGTVQIGSLVWHIFEIFK